MRQEPLSHSEVRNRLMTRAAVATHRPWKRRVQATNDPANPYNQRLSVQDPKTGNFTAEDAELIADAVESVEGLVKENLRRENENRRLAGIIWSFLEHKPFEKQTEEDHRFYEEAETAMMDMGYYSKDMTE